MPFANKIIVIHRTAVHMAVHTAMCTGRSHDPYMAVYTSVHSSVHDPLCIRHIQLCTPTWPVHGRVRVHVYTGRVHGLRPVHGLSCTRNVHGHLQGPTQPIRGLHTALQLKRPIVKRPVVKTSQSHNIPSQNVPPWSKRPESNRPRFHNWLNNQLHHVNKHSTACQSGSTTGLTTG